MTAQRYSAADRQLALVEAIRRSWGISRDKLRTTLPVYEGMSERAFARSLDRDLEALRFSGYPIVYDADRGYHVDRSSSFHAHVSNVDVGLLRAAVAGVVDDVRGFSVRTGLNKLLATSDSSKAKGIVRASIPEGDEAVPLARAIQLSVSVTFTYGAREREYELRPTRLEVHYGAFYVVGFARRLDASRGRFEHRTFRVSRMALGSLRFGLPWSADGEAPEDPGVFSFSDVIVAVRPGCAAPMIGRGESTKAQADAPTGWECIRFDHAERHRLFEDLFTYGRDVRLIADETACSAWDSRLSHISALLERDTNSLGGVIDEDLTDIQSIPVAPSEASVRKPMLNIHDIVRVHALLIYLDRIGKPVSLKELSKHFGLPWKRVLELLWTANTVDIDGVVAPFDLVLPIPPGQEDDDEEPTTAESEVLLGSAGSQELPELSLTLDETMVLVALIDSMMEVTSPGGSLTALRALRSKLVGAATESGYGSALWPEPQAPMNEEWLATLTRAIEEKRCVEFEYFQPGDGRARRREVVMIPQVISSRTNPTIVGTIDDEVRSYRLDRIAYPRCGDKVPAPQRRRSKARVEAAEQESWKPEGDIVTVKVTKEGRWAGETLPIIGRRNDDDNLVFALRSSSDEWLATLLIQLGESLIALEPRPVRERLSAIFANLVKEER
ncbi:WYL domain-containing protein [Arcanobacterium haemolyticum]|nr:WYL domain-containing protein [Arcanobacterium haemolyticum]